MRLGDEGPWSLASSAKTMCLAVASLVASERPSMLDERHEAEVSCGRARGGKPTADGKGGGAQGAPTRGASLRGDRRDSRPSTAAWLGWAAAADTASVPPWARDMDLAHCHWCGAGSSEYL